MVGRRSTQRGRERGEAYRDAESGRESSAVSRRVKTSEPVRVACRWKIEK